MKWVPWPLENNKGVSHEVAKLITTVCKSSLTFNMFTRNPTSTSSHAWVSHMSHHCTAPQKVYAQQNCKIHVIRVVGWSWSWPELKTVQERDLGTQMGECVKDFTLFGL